jgi:hypothetical protein
MLFKEVSFVYCENHIKPINTLCGQNAESLIVKADGTLGFKGLVILNLSSKYSWHLWELNEIEAGSLHELHHITFLSYHHIFHYTAWISYIHLSRMQIFLPLFRMLCEANTDAIF